MSEERELLRDTVAVTDRFVGPAAKEPRPLVILCAMTGV